MKNYNLNDYKTLVFDCDGVILNSNKIKTEAFYEAARIYGNEPAMSLKRYHIENGGVSRYKKFEYFFTNILGRNPEQSELDVLLERFSDEVKKRLLSCEVAKDLNVIKKKSKMKSWMIVSGGDQSELRDVFRERGLDEFFDGGIFGSPDTKEIILQREIESENIRLPGLFIGDSKYDYDASVSSGLDFVFVSDWSEIEGWEDWVSEKSLSHIQNISEL